MFKKETSEQDFGALQNLLAAKRQELPPQSYFDGVLPEFHKRQRALLLAPRYTFVSRLCDLAEQVRSAFQLRPALRYATAFSAVAILATVLIGSGLVGHQANYLTLQPKAATANEGYAFAQGMESQKATSVDQQIDAASVGAIGLDNKIVMPQYVIAQTPTSYDVAMAF